MLRALVELPVLLLAALANAYTPPSAAGALFWEPFAESPLSEGSKWVVPDGFPGTWQHRSYSEPVGLPEDRGIVLSSAGKRHAISTVFAEPIAGAPLVLQYESQLTKPLSCGGAYLKLLQASDELTQRGFGDSTPYAVMFGPDKCENQKLVRFIIQRRAANGTLIEHHLKSPPVPKQMGARGNKHFKAVRQTHLYTAIITSDLQIELRINGESVRTADLRSKEDFDPPLDPSVAELGAIGGIGIELFSLEAGILLDNILLTEDPSVAAAVAAATHEERRRGEVDEEARLKEVAEERKRAAKAERSKKIEELDPAYKQSFNERARAEQAQAAQAAQGQTESCAAPPA